MQFLVAIPTYWTFPSGSGPEEVVFDHPTPLDSPGTLGRTLTSLGSLVTGEIQVAVVAAAAAVSLALAVEERVAGCIRDFRLPYPVTLFSYSHLARFQEFLTSQGKNSWRPFLSLTGYSQIRNLTLLLATLRQADYLISLDDDEVVQEPDFFRQVAVDCAELSQEHPAFGLAGLYRHADGSLLLPEPQTSWAGVWPKMRWLNAALTDLTAPGPRLRPTYLGFGGNLTLSRSLWHQVPFDPALTRGEDVDYLINARMFGLPFFLDRDLAIVHLPPEKPHPTWRRIRQDVLRFAYTRLKLQQQEPGAGMVQLRAQDCKPYPGNFLGDDLMNRAVQCHTLLALEYLASGDPEGARHSLETMVLLQQLLEHGQGVWRRYMELVSQWREFQTWLSAPEVAKAARRAIWGAG